MYIFLFIIILILIICNIIIISTHMQMGTNKGKNSTKFKLKGGTKSTDLTLELKHKVDQLIKLKQNNSDLVEYSSKIKNMKKLTNKILNKL